MNADPVASEGGHCQTIGFLKSIKNGSANNSASLVSARYSILTLA